MCAKRNGYAAKRWANLVQDVRSSYDEAREEDIRNLIDSKWLERVTTPHAAGITRLALKTDMSYQDMSEEYGIQASHLGARVRDATSHLQQLYTNIRRGGIHFESPEQLYPKLVAQIDVAVAAGLVKQSIFRNISSFRHLTYEGLHSRCDDHSGLKGTQVAATLSDYQEKRICKLCREVHTLNGEPCTKGCTR